MPEIDYWAVLAAAVSSFVLGGMWYSPVLFGRIWQHAAGLSDVQLRSGNLALIFGLSLVLSLLMAVVFALLLGPNPSLGKGLGTGALAGSCWVAASFGMNYLFERKSLTLFLINGGFHTVQFTLIGLVLALWA